MKENEGPHPSPNIALVHLFTAISDLEGVSLCHICDVICEESQSRFCKIRTKLKNQAISNSIEFPFKAN